MDIYQTLASSFRGGTQKVAEEGDKYMGDLSRVFFPLLGVLIISWGSCPWVTAIITQELQFGPQLVPV